MSVTTYQAIAMIIYFVLMIMLGLLAYVRTNTLDDYMLGGRQLGPGVAALSAGASDMSGWLLMGLPGAVYLNGLIDIWIAVGLTIGTYLNWKFVAPRLRAYTQISSNSITIPSFLHSRVRDKSNVIRIVSGIIIMVFFTFYVSSGMVAGGAFFESSFDMNYHLGMVIVSAIVVLYTLIGGFLAVSWTDVVQGLMMVIALVLVPAVAIMHVGGFSNMIDIIQTTDKNLLMPFGAGGIAWMTLISAISWGLGYFGQPHIIVRFMAIRDVKEAKSARRIAMSWLILALAGSSLTALAGVAVYKHDTGVLPNAEAVFIALGQLLFHPLIAGFMLAAILAAIMSTISAQLLVTSSALVEDIYRAFTSRDISGNEGVLLGRIAVGSVSLIAAILAWGRSDTVLALVAFAWAGFGASFGPTILLSLYWRKLTYQGAIAGMVSGAIVVAVWGNLSGGIFDLYEIIPGFLANLIVAILVSNATYQPNPEIEEEFNLTVEAILGAKTKK